MRWKQFFVPAKNMRPDEARNFMAAHKEGEYTLLDVRQPGDLLVSSRAYDKRVAGVISGAGGVSPGLLVGQKGSEAYGANPVALTGRVYCWAASR